MIQQAGNNKIEFHRDQHLDFSFQFLFYTQTSGLDLCLNVFINIG